MAEESEYQGIRRRADKLRIVSWINLLVCVVIGIFGDFGDTVTRWTVAMGWSVLVLAVFHWRAAHMDREGPVKRK